MHLQHQSGRARRQRGFGQRRDEVPSPGRVRDIGDDGQCRFLPQDGDGRHVEREARLPLKGANAPLAQNDAAVAAAVFGQVFRREKEFVDGGGEGALQKHRFSSAARLLEQRVVGHVAGADLQDVRQWRHVLQLPRISDFRDSGQPMPVRRGPEHFDAVDAQPQSF